MPEKRTTPAEDIKKLRRSEVLVRKAMRIVGTRSNATVPVRSSVSTKVALTPNVCRVGCTPS